MRNSIQKAVFYLPPTAYSSLNISTIYLIKAAERIHTMVKVYLVMLVTHLISVVQKKMTNVHCERKGLFLQNIVLI